MSPYLTVKPANLRRLTLAPGGNFPFWNTQLGFLQHLQE
jgi:hypothetical protein